MSDWDDYEDGVEETGGPADGDAGDVEVEMELPDEDDAEETGGPALVVPGMGALAIPPALQGVLGLLGGGAAPRKAKPKAKVKGGGKVIRLRVPSGKLARRGDDRAARPGGGMRLPGVAREPRLINGDVVHGLGVGTSGNLGGELQSFGADVIASATFTAVAGAWGGKVEILQPGLGLMWDFSAESGDYDAAWVTSGTINTKPWSVPAGSKLVVADMSYKRNFPIAPEPCELAPGDNLSIYGTATAAANKYTVQILGVCSDRLDYRRLDSRLIRYIANRGWTAKLRNRMIIGLS